MIFKASFSYSEGFFFNFVKKISDHTNRDFRRPTLVLPFINDEISKKIRNRFNAAKLECNVSFKVLKLYHLTKSQTQPDRPEDILNKCGVIYKLTCKIEKRKG